MPSTPGPVPAVIGIHGGFWRNAYSLDHFGHLCAALTTSGYATCNLEYRRLGDEGGGWPGTFLDIVAGARYVIEHARQWNIDPARIAVIGHSAGGHLATWLASLTNVDPYSDIAAEPLPLRGAVSLAGVLDLVEASTLALSNGAVDELLGGSRREAPDRYADASPIALVPAPVPVIAIHGSQDHIVPPDFSHGYAVAASAAGGDAIARILPNLGHFELIDPESVAWAVVLSAVKSLFPNSVTPARFPLTTPSPKTPVRTGWR